MKMYQHPIYGLIPVLVKQKIKKTSRVKPMTEWQKKKIGWYRNGKSWDRHVDGRVELPNGDIAVKDERGNIKEVLPKGGLFYGK